MIIKDPKILIVDDEPAITDVLKAILAKSGLDALTANSARDGLAILKSEKIDVVVSDVMMPDVTGLEFMEKVHHAHPDIPVILMTGFADLDMSVEAIKKGVFDFIVKPINKDLIFHAVSKAIQFTGLKLLERDYMTNLEQAVHSKTQKLCDLNYEIVHRLTAVAEYRDTDTGSHISRIGIYAGLMAESLGWSEDQVDKIKLASSLHDIGKVGIPDHILLKPGPLTKMEFEVIKTHTTLGSSMLAGSDHEILEMAANIALCHHEKWDGTGYPNGLKGSDIPIEGRIAIVADQYDALRSRRPYKTELEHMITVGTILEGDGRTLPEHFDPKILKTFKKLAPKFNNVYNNLETTGGHLAFGLEKSLT